MRGAEWGLGLIGSFFFLQTMPITRSGEAILKDVNEVILKLEAERARLMFKNERTGTPCEYIMVALHDMVLRLCSHGTGSKWFRSKNRAG